MYELQKEISHISLNQLSMTDYFTNFKVLWDKLENQDPLPSCACGVMLILRDKHDREYVIRFLMGLNENYATVRSQILTRDPVPLMNKVYSLVLQEE